MRSFVRIATLWLLRALVFGAALCLAVVFVSWQQATFYQVRARGELADMVADATDHAREMPEPAIVPAKEVHDSSLIGFLDIPRLDLSVAALDGDDTNTLRIAIGHVRGTELPWNDGNTVFAAHRDTFFRSLDQIAVGDAIRIRTSHGTFEYRVEHLLVVNPEEVWVQGPLEGVNLTLITCYPFRYLGLAPQRFIVQATRVSSQ